MKIKITTEREILDDDYWDWILELRKAGIPIGGVELKEKGFYEWVTDIGYTSAKTRYEII